MSPCAPITYIGGAYTLSLIELSSYLHPIYRGGVSLAIS